MPILVGTVHLEVYDSAGNLIRTIDKHNAETLWAKFHTPTTIYLDFITQPFSETVGVDDINKLNKTVWNQANTIRSGLLSVQFSQSGNTYSASFNWTNSTFHSYKLYGLLSYTGSSVYTIFDMSDQPIDIPPNTVVVGRYVIEYDKPTPADPVEEVTTSSTITDNRLIVLSDSELTPDMRTYKYSRSFVKSSYYHGVDTSDTDINSVISVSIDSNDTLKRGFGNSSTAEVFYKFLESGSPGGGKAVRFLSYYDISHRSRLVTGNLAYKIEDYFWVDKDSSGYATKIVHYAKVKSLWVNSDNTEVKPWKYNFPTALNTFASETSWWNGHGIYCNCYNAITPRVVYTADKEAFIQDIMYLYWPDNPTFNVYLYSYTDTIGAKLYVNGQEFTPTSITDIGNKNRKITFDLSGITQGEGIVVFNASNAHYFAITENGTTNIRVVTNKLAYETNMYGYVVPYVGFLAEGSSAITDNYISAGFCGFGGSNVDMTTRIDSSNVSNLSVVTGVPLDQLRNLTEHQYFIWVKQTESDKIAGRISAGTTGMILTYSGRYNNDETMCAICPVYVGESNFIAFRPENEHSSQEISDYLGREGLLEDTFSMVDNNHVQTNHTSREVTFHDDKAYNVILNDLKSYLCRKQGDTNYSMRMPESLADYTEGTATVTHSGVLYEFETIIDADENLGYLTVHFGSSSTFAINEYLSFPVVDSYGLMITDALETWKQYQVYNFPRTSETVVDNDDNVGTDELYDCVNCDDNRAIASNFSYLNSMSIDKLKSTIGLQGDPNFYFTIKVPLTNEYNVKRVVLVPKRFTDEHGDTRYVNVESIVVTDGLRIVPWYLDNYGFFSRQTDISWGERFDNWVLILNHDVLRSIADVENPEGSMLFHVYFQAKKKEEILPIEVDFSCGLLGPNGGTDDDTILLLEPDHSTGQIISPNCRFSYDGWPVEINNATVNEQNKLVFDPSQQSYIKFTEDFHHRMILLNENKQTTIELNFRLNSYPSEYSVLLQYMFSGQNTSSFTDQLDLFGFTFFIDQTGQLVFKFVDVYNWYCRSGGCADRKDWWKTKGNGPYYLSNRLQLNRDYYFVFEYTDSTIRVYLNGRLMTEIEISDKYHIGYYTHGWNVVHHSSLYIGKAISDDSYFDGEMSFIRIQDKTLWNNEHTYIDKPFKWYDNVPTIVYNEGDTQIRVNLPYAIDDGIDVIDDTGNHVDFCHLKTGNFGVEDINDIGEILFIKGPEMHWDNSNVVRSSVQTTVFSTASSIFNQLQYSGAAVYDSISSTSSKMSVYSYRQSYNYSGSELVKPYDEYYDYYKYKDLANTIYYVYHNIRKKYKIVSSSTKKSSEPNDILPIYTVPNNILDAATIRYNWDNEETVTTYSFLNPMLDGKGLLFDTAQVNRLEIIGATSQYNETDLKLASIYATSIAGGLDITLKNFGFMVEIPPARPGMKNGYSRNSYLYSHSGDWTSQYTVFYKNINLTSFIAWKEPDNALWTHKSVNVSTLPRITDFQTDYYWIECKHLTDIEPVTDTDGKLYQIDSLLSTLQYGAFKITDADVINRDFKIKTYAVTSFETAYPVYTNFFGTHIFSAIDEPLNFTIRLGNHSVYAKNDFSYVLTKDEEFLNLLKNNMLKLGYAELSYVDNSYTTYVPKATTVSDTETDTVVIWKHSVSPLYDNTSVYSQTFPASDSISQAVYLDGRVSDDVLLKNRTQFYDNYLFNIVQNNIDSQNFTSWVRSFEALWSHIADLEFAKPPFLRRGIDEWQFTKFKQEYWFKVGGVKAYLQQFHVDEVSHRVLRNTQLDWDAALTEVLIAPLANRQTNVIFDPTKLPTTSIVDLGNFSVIGSMTVNNTSYVIPLVKITNTTTGEQKIFALTKEYNTPEEVSYFIPDAISDPVKNYWFTYHYQKNLYSYEPFNSLLEEFNSNEFVLQYGLFIQTSSSTRDDFAVIKSLVVQPEFSDESLYHSVPYCYLVKDDLHNQPDTARAITQATNKVYFKNTSNQDLTNVVLEVDLKEIDTTQFTNGMSAYLNNNHLPTIYEMNDYGQLTNDFSKANKKRLFVKVTTIPANQIIEIELRDETIGDTPTSVFDTYIDFSQDMSAVSQIITPDVTYPTVSDTANSTERISVAKPQQSAYLEDSALVLQSIDPVVVVLNETFDTSKVYEFGYSTDTDIDFSILFSPQVPTIEKKEVPFISKYNVAQPDNAPSVSDTDNGTSATSSTDRIVYVCKLSSEAVYTYIEYKTVRGVNKLAIDYQHESTVSTAFDHFMIYEDFESGQLPANSSTVQLVYVGSAGCCGSAKRLVVDTGALASFSQVITLPVDSEIYCYLASNSGTTAYMSIDNRSTSIPAYSGGWFLFTLTNQVTAGTHSLKFGNTGVYCCHQWFLDNLYSVPKMTYKQSFRQANRLHIYTHAAEERLVVRQLLDHCRLLVDSIHINDSCLLYHLGDRLPYLSSNVDINCTDKAYSNYTDQCFTYFKIELNRGENILYLYYNGDSSYAWPEQLLQVYPVDIDDPFLFSRWFYHPVPDHRDGRSKMMSTWSLSRFVTNAFWDFDRYRLRSTESLQRFGSKGASLYIGSVAGRVEIAHADDADDYSILLDNALTVYHRGDTCCWGYSWTHTNTYARPISFKFMISYTDPKGSYSNYNITDHLTKEIFEEKPYLAVDDIALITNDEETGSWTINGVTYTKRRKLTVVSEVTTKTSKAKWIRIGKYLHNNDNKVMLVRESYNGDELATVPSKEPTILKIIKQADSIYNEFRPVHTEFTHWINESVYSTADNFEIPDNSKIIFTARTGGYYKSKVYFIRAKSNDDHKYVKQIFKDDVGILIKNVATNWYYFDFNSTQQADLNSVKSEIDRYNKKFPSFPDNGWIDFPETSKLANSTFVYGRTLKYVLHDHY